MKRKTIVHVIEIVLLAIIITFIGSAVVDRHKIIIIEYEVPIERLNNDSKIVVIADMHSREYGENNSKLIELIAKQEPDAIFAVGDIISRNADEEDIQRMLDLFVRLEEIAPVFFAPGNHEMDLILAEDGVPDLMDRIRNVSVTALCDEFVETEFGGNTIRVGGTLGHYHGYNWTQEQWNAAVDYAMEEEIGSGDIPSIVMMHMPETLVKDADWVTDKWQVDLFLSGHTHGGLIRLPGIGGLIAPTQGLFPKYDRGEYLFNGKHELIISAGLAGYGIIPRVFNPPEIVVIDLVAK